MSVSAVIVTRGDQDIVPVLASLPTDWEVLVWDNGRGRLTRTQGSRTRATFPVSDMGVYGRYAAISYATRDLVYVQDDDCIVSDPQALVGAYSILDTCPEHGQMPRVTMHGYEKWTHGVTGWACNECRRFSPDAVVCNMPPEFRHDFYEEHALVGFGAAFYRDAPFRAFDRWTAAYGNPGPWGDEWARCCDVVFTGLTPRVLVDVPKEDLPYAHHETRMWKQPGHQAERARVLDKVRAIA